MTIRARVTLWYLAILLVALGVMSAVLSYELLEAQRIARQPAVSPEPILEEVGEFLLYCGLPMTLLILAGGWLLIRRALAPITQLIQTAERIHAHNLQERLPVRGRGDELDRLTEVFNAMIGRLDDSFSRIREFTLHASHELKTPLTVMQGELGTALRQLSWTPAQRDLIANQLDEIQRLATIVDGLTLLAKADAGQVPIAQDAVRLDELVQDSFADAQILAGPAQLGVTLSACDPVVVQGDRHRLRQLLLNLTDNAIKYNHPRGEVTMALRLDHGTARLNITNSGPGISTELLPRVFDRFFRAQGARNGSIDGCGLGLSIAQWITRAHGGSIQISSTPGQSTDVSVQLPASAPSTSAAVAGGLRRRDHREHRGA